VSKVSEKREDGGRAAIEGERECCIKISNVSGLEGLGLSDAWSSAFNTFEECQLDFLCKMLHPRVRIIIE
jgi:hypothetical protein